MGPLYCPRCRQPWYACTCRRRIDGPLYCPRCRQPWYACTCRRNKIDVSFECWVCDHFHYKEHTKIGTKEEISCVAAESLHSIVQWHATLFDQKDELLKNKQLNHYILFNRMENIKSVFNTFRQAGELDEELATSYAITHMIIERNFMDKNVCTFKNIYTLFIEYIKSTYDCLNFINGNDHPTSTELINNGTNETNGTNEKRKDGSR